MMALFLTAAYQILSTENRPLPADEITQLARDRGLLPTTGRTPAQTMKSKLSTDILRRGDASVFMRSDKGLFALRAWKHEIGEHIADRYTKALFDEDIVVIPVNRLSRYVP